MKRCLFAVVLLVFVCGCSEVKDRFLPIPDKIGKAFPVNPKIRVAEEEVLALLRSTPDTLVSFEHEYRLRKELRALTCTLGLTIGRYDSVETIRSLLIL